MLPQVIIPGVPRRAPIWRPGFDGEAYERSRVILPQRYRQRPRRAAISIDGTTTSGSAVNFPPGSTLSFNRVIGSGLSNSILVVQVTARNTGGAVDVSTVKLDATTSLTAISGTKQTDASGNLVEMYYLLSPAAATVSVDIVMAATCDRPIMAGAILLSGVDQGTPFGTAGTNTGSGTTITTTCSSATGEVVLGVCRAFAAVQANFSSADTEQWEQYEGSVVAIANGSDAAGAASVVSTWTTDNMFDANWSACNVPLKPAGAGGTGRRERLTMMGVG